MSIGSSFCISRGDSYESSDMKWFAKFFFLFLKKYRYRSRFIFRNVQSERERVISKTRRGFLIVRKR